MTEVEKLISDVKAARQRVVEAVRHLSSEQGAYKLSPDRWSVAEILEHLVLAEQGGINLMWKAADGFRKGKPVWKGESPNRGLIIEKVIEKTWKSKEKAPESATPRTGGPIQYWIAALDTCQPQLQELGMELKSLNLSEIIYPHFLSGPLDARQRLEFLRFHLDRHLKQIEALLEDPGFPA
jgi:hypothetical protein